MAISKERKHQLVAHYVEQLESSRAIIITDYRSLSTPELGRLRSAVREVNGVYSVVKLTLFKLALEKAGIPVPEGMLRGPVAVGYCYQDVPGVAKALKDFGKEQELLTIKGGIMGDRTLSVAEVEAIASLPPVEVVRARLLGLICGPARSMASAVAAGVRQVVNVFSAYADSEREGQPVGAEV